MLDYLKNYYVFMLVLMVFSFLVPREDYKAYIQFFIGIFLIVLLLKPILLLFTAKEPEMLYEVFEGLNVQIEDMDLEKGETIYEHFFSEGEGQ